LPAQNSANKDKNNSSFPGSFTQVWKQVGISGKKLSVTVLILNNKQTTKKDFLMSKVILSC
jgi:hypothetical protein